MSDKAGFISIHRKILDHWVCNSRHPYSNLEAWLDILLNVNQETGKPVVIDGRSFVADRGQSLYSLETWARRWRWDKSKVRRYLERLQKDEMVVINNEKKTTRITVCNFDTYNKIKHTVDTRSTPNNNILLSNDNSNINNRREAFQKELILFHPQYSKDLLNAFYRHWSEMNKSKTKMKFETEKTWELNLRLAKWKDNNFAGKFKNNNQDNSDVGN